MKNIKTIKNLKNKTILLRADFNVPLKDSKILDQTRILKSLPTILYLQKQGAKIVLISHLGRPKGKINKKYSLKPVALVLQKKINSSKVKNFKFLPDSFVWEKESLIKTKKIIDQSKPGSVLLLENIRFAPREEKNCLKWAKTLASLGDIYINDAFGVSHRKNSSVVGITKYLPSYPGLLLTQEIERLNQVIKSPRKPLVSIIGGAKISTKLELIGELAKKGEVLIGGALANNFFKGFGYQIGGSVYQKEMIKETKKLIKKYIKINKKNKLSGKLILPVDLKIQSGKNIQTIKTVDLNNSKKLNKLNINVKRFQILDIGPKTITEFRKKIKSAKTIIWNGPLGYIEEPVFSKGTIDIAKAIINNKQAQIVIGGGETTSVLQRIKGYKKINNKKQNKTKNNNKINNKLFISTGGGAMLKFLSKEKLPGIEALK